VLTHDHDGNEGDNTDHDAFEVWRTSSGGLTQVAAYNYADNYAPEADFIQTGDFDNDGLIDIAMTVYNQVDNMPPGRLRFIWGLPAAPK
jgi:hypothetical protein